MELRGLEKNKIELELQNSTEIAAAKLAYDGFKNAYKSHGVYWNHPRTHRISVPRWIYNNAKEISLQRQLDDAIDNKLEGTVIEGEIKLIRLKLGSAALLHSLQFGNNLFPIDEKDRVTQSLYDLGVTLYPVQDNHSAPFRNSGYGPVYPESNRAWIRSRVPGVDTPLVRK